MKIPVTALTAALVTALTFCAFGINIGDPAAEIRLQTLDGDTFDLQQHSGEVVLLYTFGCT